jgi:diguanylate cyclase (GGDEF)-like protein
MAALPDSIDFIRFADLALRLLPDCSGFAILDGDGKCCAVNDEALGEHFEAGRQLAEKSSVETSLATASSNGYAIVYASLSEDWQIAVLSDKWDPASVPTGHIESLEALASGLATEMSLNAELDRMAIELADRYDELNLVYHTDDQVTYFREGEDALRKLVENCAEFMGAMLAVLRLPGKGVTVRSDADHPVFEKHGLDEMLDGPVLEWITANQDALVVNSPAQSIEMLGVDHNLQILSCPVPGSDGQPDGVLAVLALPGQRTYSNSDKNLLSVMARKVAKIIQSSYDPLTGLLNRHSFGYFVDASIERARTGAESTCLLHVNIDQIHLINDTLSHEAGDTLIREVAACIRTGVRESDAVSRLGGDEFGVLLADCDSRDARDVSEKLRAAVDALEITWENDLLKPSISIGVSVVTSEAVDLEQVMTDAELACELAKDRGRNRVQFYKEGSDTLKQREHEMWMVGQIRDALNEDSFVLYAQPIVPLDNKSDGHVEVLLRMAAPDGSVLPPGEFMPAAERYQLMTEIDTWVFAHTIDRLQEDMPDDLVVAINLSGQTMGSQDFLEMATQKIALSGVSPDRICLEITETAAVDNMEEAHAFIAALRDLGCRFALDDFGAGMSSFGYLKSFDVDYLKIDGELVRGIVDDPVSQAMVSAINQVGHVMGLQTIAEFVEDNAMRDRLEDIGVDFVQGYGIGKPEPLDAFLARFEEQALPAVS